MTRATEDQRSSPQALPQSPRRLAAGFAAGGLVGVLGGMIGLGGAEFRLPLLIGVFGFTALAAVILNKAMGLAVVTAALPARLIAVPLDTLTPHWNIVVNLLAGSLIGAWLGANWATRMRSATLYKVLAALLVAIAAVLLANHFGSLHPVHLDPVPQTIAGLLAGAIIGMVAALMGVAGGELLIPTIVLLYGIGIKTAGSLALAVSLPTMLIAFARYSRDRTFIVLRQQARFVTAMAAGSITGVLTGGLLLTVAPGDILIPILAGILTLSAIKIWKDD